MIRTSGATVTARSRVRFDSPVTTLATANASHAANAATAEQLTYGLYLDGGTKWFGGVLAPNGKIYCAPASATDMLIIDTINGTAERKDYGLSWTADHQKWATGVYVPNASYARFNSASVGRAVPLAETDWLAGKIYFIPRSASEKVLVLDLETDTATETDYGLNLVGLQKWIGSALGLDGLIYTAPYDRENILVIDPAARTASLETMGVDLSGTSKWVGATLAPNGKIYCTPRNADDFLIIDTINQTAERTDLGCDLTFASFTKWSGGVLGADGRIWCMPRGDVDELLIINPTAGTAVRTDLGVDMTGFECFSACAGADGLIYASPQDCSGRSDLTRLTLVIDPIAESAWFTDFGLNQIGSNKFAGAVMGADGAAYSIPRSEQHVLRIQPATAPALPLLDGLSPYLNKF